MLSCVFTRFLSGGDDDTEHFNEVTVAGTDDDGAPFQGSDDAVVLFEVIIPFEPTIDLEVTTDFDPESVALDSDPATSPDETTVLTVNVVNQGPSDATGVEVTIDIPDGLVFISDVCTAATGGDCDYDPTTVLLILGSVGAGDTATVEIELAATVPGVFVAVAEVTKADQTDIDSVPGDGAGDDYDESPELVVTQVAASAVIGDLVFEDLDMDGVADPGEPGIPGVTVQLTNTSDGSTTTAVTNADGQYLFSALPIGTFQVTVVSGVPAGLSSTTPSVVAVTIASDGQSFLGADFGFGTESLPKTGTDSRSLAAWGLSLMLLGASIAIAVRRREARSDQ